MAVGDPAQRAPTTIASYIESLPFTSSLAHGCRQGESWAARAAPPPSHGPVAQQAWTSSREVSAGFVSTHLFRGSRPAYRPCGDPPSWRGTEFWRPRYGDPGPGDVELRFGIDRPPGGPV